VHDVDPDLIQRTRQWLLRQRRADGSWDPESHEFEGGPGGAAADRARLRTTAYIAWAALGHKSAAPESQPTADYLLKHEAKSITDAYTLALVANALQALRPGAKQAAPYLDRLVALRQSAGGGKLVWWDGAGRTTFHGAGRSGNIETTALACLALLTADREPAAVRGALGWLATQRDGSGAWHSTQATVLALKALLAGTGRPLGADQERRIDITLDGKPVENVVIPADQADLMRQINLSDRVARGTRALELADLGNTATGYQVVLRYHRPHQRDKTPAGLAIQLAYDRQELKVNEDLKVTATVSNRGTTAAPMVMVELPIPAGFTLDGDDLAKLVETQAAAKVQRTPQQALLYLRGLGPGQSVTIPYRLRAVMAGTISAAPARVYEYYDPDRTAQSGAATVLLVTAARAND
jgi:uncharacterized protein YfaS (alpha-2-macroglobulin family)